jgi:hypothetical protein
MIKVNNKEVTNPIAQIFWGTFAILITWWVFFLVGVIFLGIALAFTFPVWVPIVLIKLL